MQAKALIPIVKELKNNGIHVCLDTNGGIWNLHVEKLLSMTDLVLLDVKEFNHKRHETLTGRSNTQTLQTARWLEEHNRPFWLRYVLVPGYSDFEEDIRALADEIPSIREETDLPVIGLVRATIGIKQHFAPRLGLVKITFINISAHPHRTR